MQSQLQRACLGVVVATGLIAVVGCKSSGPTAAVEQRIETANHADAMRKELRDADAQVSSTQMTLQQLSTQQSGNLDSTFSTFKSDVDKNESMSKNIDSSAKKLSTESFERVNEWGYQARTITDEGLRQKSLDRQEATRQQSDAVTLSMNEVRAAYGRYIRELKDVQTYASQDLTPTGVAGLHGNTERTTKAAQELHQKIVGLDGRLDQLASSWRAELPLGHTSMEGESATPAGAEVTSPDKKANQPAKPGDMP